MWQIIFVDANGDGRNGGISEYTDERVAMEEAYYKANKMTETYRIKIVGVVLDKVAD